MGEKYVTPPIISFESIFEQSTPMSPIVFILSPGSDPASDLMKLAERTGFGTNKLKYLSLGQGQEKASLIYYVTTQRDKKNSESEFTGKQLVILCNKVANL